MAEKQAKIGEKQENMAETNQKWQKRDKNSRKFLKCISSQAKVEEKQENMAETNQKWQTPDKKDRKTDKMKSFTNNFLPSVPFLSCQAPISDLPSSHFCQAH